LGQGLPIESALAAVAEQADKQRVKGLIMAVRSKVLEGYSLAVSLSDHEGSFNGLYRATVAAGEQSGFLDKVLENLADYEERQFSATRNVEMALIYPAVLLGYGDIDHFRSDGLHRARHGQCHCRYWPRVTLVHRCPYRDHGLYGQLLVVTVCGARSARRL
jgi:hypothetical protein